ncbi:unnamed protein product [Didymodactylos carnosus]|uniref:Uncharacterized protein n=1 Tax=Didymodactylos carnosus TaxID=1234261 RepID=A0A815H8C0_9BILA|nr:unnamed protein product [Didymodactylos carnosus]CAF4216549.1 unnamed protein product [Didymodactylos carnosus]
MNYLLRYPLSFIEKQFQKFSSDYLSTTSFIPLIDDEKQYFLLRNKLFHRQTAEESKSNLNYIASNFDPQQVTTATTTNISTKSSMAATAKVKKYEDKLIFHYTHEKRFHSFKRDMQKLYKDHFRRSIGHDYKNGGEQS